MKGQSNNKPDKVIQTRGGYQVRYNITEKTQEIDGEQQTYYEYDYVSVDKLAEEDIAVAIIRTKYSINDEMKLINGDQRTTEYSNYRDFVSNAVSIAENITGG